MPNDLVNWRHPNGEGEPRETGAHTDLSYDEGVPPEEWDRPPTNPLPGPIHDRDSRAGVRQAEHDARQARHRGDTTFAHLREGDAGDNSQVRWDWGGPRDWLWIAVMCAYIFLLTALLYFLPHGQHASPPPIRVY